MLPSHHSDQPSSPPSGLGWTGLEGFKQLYLLTSQISFAEREREKETVVVYLVVSRVLTGTAWRPGAWLLPSCRRFRARRTPPTLTNIPGTRPSHRTNSPAGTRSSEPTTLSALPQETKFDVQKVSAIKWIFSDTLKPQLAGIENKYNTTNTTTSAFEIDPVYPADKWR